MSYGECSRCGDFGTKTALAGVYTARLCISCTNDWDAHCFDSKQFVNLYKAEADYQVLGVQMIGGKSVPDAEAKAHELLGKIVDAKKEMYKFAKEWAEKKIERKTEDAEE